MYVNIIYICKYHDLGLLVIYKSVRHAREIKIRDWGKGFLIVTRASVDRSRTSYYPASQPLPCIPKINMSAGSYLRSSTILFSAFERIRAIICILLEALGSTSVRAIVRSASPLGLSAHHDRFALAAGREKERKREREDRGSRREESATNK